VSRKRALQLSGVARSTSDLLGDLRSAIRKAKNTLEKETETGCLIQDPDTWSPLATLAIISADTTQDAKYRIEAARVLAPYLHVALKPTESVAPQQQNVVIIGNDKQAERRATVIGDDSRKVWVGESYTDDEPEPQRRIESRAERIARDDDNETIDIRAIEKEVDLELAEERRRNG
jgi:hypothetical protein